MPIEYFGDDIQQEASVAIKLSDGDLECPVCTGTIYPPMKPCENGHTICVECRAKLKKLEAKCPYCRGEFREVRDYELERVYRKAKVACRYKDYGCQEQDIGKEMLLHQTTCSFKHPNAVIEDFSHPDVTWDVIGMMIVLGLLVVAILTFMFWPSGSSTRTPVITNPVEMQYAFYLLRNRPLLDI